MFNCVKRAQFIFLKLRDQLRQYLDLIVDVVPFCSKATLVNKHSFLETAQARCARKANILTLEHIHDADTRECVKGIPVPHARDNSKLWAQMVK